MTEPMSDRKRLEQKIDAAALLAIIAVAAAYRRPRKSLCDRIWDIF